LLKASNGVAVDLVLLSERCEFSPVEKCADGALAGIASAAARVEIERATTINKRERRYNDKMNPPNIGS
jgi:hypothetical protein